MKYLVHLWAAATAEKVCEFGMQFVLVQDVSESYKDDMPNIQTYIPDFFNEISTDYPGSRFGLVTFSDKPVEDLGLSNSFDFHDYCRHTDTSLTEDVDVITDRLENVLIRSGIDEPESQLDAILHAALSDEIGWDHDAVLPGGHPVKKVIMIATDATYHVEGDVYTEIIYEEMRNHWVPSNLDGNVECLKEDYPPVGALGDVLRANNFYVVFVVTEKVANLYTELLWAFNVPGTVVLVADDSSDLNEALDEVLSAIQIDECSEEVVIEPVCNGLTWDIKHVHHAFYGTDGQLETMKSELIEAYDSVSTLYPGSELGIYTFSDRGIEPWGYEDDACIWTHTELSSDRIQIASAAQGLVMMSGYDIPDSHLQTLHFIGKTRWEPSNTGRTGGLVVRVVVLVSHSFTYHTAGTIGDIGIPHDGSDSIGCDCYSEDADPDNCVILDYPTIEQVAAAFVESGAFLVLYVPSWEMSKASDLLTELGIDGLVVEDREECATYSGDIVQVLNYAAEAQFCSMVPTPAPTTTTTTTASTTSKSTTTASTTTRAPQTPPGWTTTTTTRAPQTPPGWTTTTTTRAPQTPPGWTTTTTTRAPQTPPGWTTTTTTTTRPGGLATTTHGPGETTTTHVGGGPSGSTQSPGEGSVGSTTEQTTTEEEDSDFGAGIVVGAAAGGLVVAGAVAGLAYFQLFPNETPDVDAGALEAGEAVTGTENREMAQALNEDDFA